MYFFDNSHRDSTIDDVAKFSSSKHKAKRGYLPISRSLNAKGFMHYKCGMQKQLMGDD
jgi:hypothetical protein